MIRSFYLVIFYLFSISNSLFSQFIYNNVITDAVKFNYFEFEEIRKNHFQNSVELINYLPKNYSEKGDVDYTDFLQRGINENRNVIMPDFPILINYNGLRLMSNSKVLFQENSLLNLQSNREELYGLIYIENVINVKVFYPKLVGDRLSHKADKGEWGMGFFIRHAKNVEIYKGMISNMWGDGIYLGNLDGMISENIIIDNCWVDNCRRNGISVISCKNSIIRNSVISNTNGTSPEFGVDFEPNNSRDIIQNMLFYNNKTINNKNGGMLFALDYMKNFNKNAIYIDVNNYSDEKSAVGIEFAMDRGYLEHDNKKVKGKIRLTNIRLNNNIYGVKNNGGKPTSIELIMSHIFLNNKRMNNSDIDDLKSSYKMGREKILNNK